MSVLLPFHSSILEHIHDPATSEFVLLARGLGLRRIICKLLQIYDSPQNLVLLVNAHPGEEAAIEEALGIMGCRNPGLRIVGFETGRKDRYASYPRYACHGSRSNILNVGKQTGLVQEGRYALNNVANSHCRHALRRHPHTSYHRSLDFTCREVRAHIHVMHP